MVDPFDVLLTDEEIEEQMEMSKRHRLMDYLREEMMPTVFCEGCGCGTVLNGYAHAMDEMGIRPEDFGPAQAFVNVGWWLLIRRVY